MIKDGGLSFETQLRIEFLPPNNGSKKCLEKSLINLFIVIQKQIKSARKLKAILKTKTQIYSFLFKTKDGCQKYYYFQLLTAELKSTSTGTRKKSSRHGSIPDASLRRLMQRLRDISSRASLQTSETSLRSLRFSHGPL